MTPAEKVLWQALRGNKLSGYHFRRQQIIAGFIVDFYCHAASLIIEVDGGIHNRQKDYDAERNRVFTEMGLRVIHVRNEDVLEDISRVLQQIRAAISPTDY
jgi:very-short-patch-repair endonuclease